MELTKNEALALAACLNYDTKENQLSDNYSNGGPEEFAALLGWNGQQVGGLITSLTEKGLGFEDTEMGVFEMTEKGVEAIFDYIAENGQPTINEEGAA